MVGTWGSGGGPSSRGAPGRGVKLGRRAAVPGRVTVSRDIAPARTVPDRAVPAQSARPRPLPRAEVVRPGAATSVRRGVEALRRALDDGTVHHHRGAGVPARRRAPGVEVVRVWAAGLGVEEQRRACRTCAGTSAGR